MNTIRANRYTPEQASDELELPLAAIQATLIYHADIEETVACASG